MQNDNAGHSGINQQQKLSCTNGISTNRNTNNRHEHKSQNKPDNTRSGRSANNFAQSVCPKIILTSKTSRNSDIGFEIVSTNRFNTLTVFVDYCWHCTFRCITKCLIAFSSKRNEMERAKKQNQTRIWRPSPLDGMTCNLKYSIWMYPFIHFRFGLSLFIIGTYVDSSDTFRYICW